MTLISLEDAKAEVRKVVPDFKTRYDINYRLNSLPSIELEEATDHEAEQIEPQTMVYPQVDGVTPSVIVKDCTTCKYQEAVSVVCGRCDRHHSNYVPQTDCGWK